MKLFHTTTYTAAQAIFQSGFRDNEATYMTVQMWRGVWLSDRPLDSNEGTKGTEETVLLCLDMPDEVLAPYEWIEEGKPYREFLVPAETINRYEVELCLEDWES